MTTEAAIDRIAAHYEPGDLCDGCVVCKPDPSHYGGRGFAETVRLWQYGKCDNCGIPTISVAKWMVCHHCGKTIYGT